MDDITGIILLIVGIVLGGLSMYLAFRGRVESARRNAISETGANVQGMQENIRLKDADIVNLNQRITSANKDRDDLISANSGLAAQLNAEKDRVREQIELLDKAQVKMGETFKSLSSDALAQNNQSFLILAEENLKKFQEGAKTDLEARQKSIETLLQPVSKSLAELDVEIKKGEEQRIKNSSDLQAGITRLTENDVRLQAETSKLVNALKTPGVRGRWGELQLRRVAELAGMVDHCDFFEQESADSEEGKKRPDMLISLPGDRTIIVDSKAPVLAYLEALEATDDEGRRECLDRHAKHIRKHIDQLSAKAYWENFKGVPEFVVLFVPGEVFFSAAVESDPLLIEYGISQKIVLASPTTLIALLLAVAHGWREQHIAEHAEEISEIGKELYDRISKFREQYAKVGKQLASAVDAFNGSLGSMDSRVLVSARKLKQLNVTSAEPIESVDQIEKIPRKCGLENGD